MPYLKELAKKHADRGLVLIGVHTTNKGEDMAAFVEAQGIQYPVAVDVEQKTTTAFAVDSYPDYYLIDRAGRLRVADLANADLDDAVEKLLAEPMPDAAKPDAEKLYSEALAQAKETERKVLLHLHAPG